MVRPFRAQDHSAIQGAVKAVYDTYGFTWEPQAYHADLFDIPGHYAYFWVAELAGDVVGGVGLQPHALTPGAAGGVTHRRVNATDAELVRLYLHPRAHKHGLGRALTQAVIDQAHTLGLQALELWSDKRFTDAHALYLKMGARIVGERICDDPDESPEWGLYLPIRASAPTP